MEGDLMRAGRIVNVRQGSELRRHWLRRNLTEQELHNLDQLPGWVREEMSVYRCVDCHKVGVLVGDGSRTFKRRGRRCGSCYKTSHDSLGRRARRDA